jgi:hypothetical protein
MYVNQIDADIFLKGGEIDVLEGVHDNEHNQVTWHTGPGCYLTPNDNFTGSLVVSLAPFIRPDLN